MGLVSPRPHPTPPQPTTPPPHHHTPTTPAPQTGRAQRGPVARRMGVKINGIVQRHSIASTACSIREPSRERREDGGRAAGPRRIQPTQDGSRVRRTAGVRVLPPPRFAPAGTGRGDSRKLPTSPPDPRTPGRQGRGCRDRLQGQAEGCRGLQTTLPYTKSSAPRGGAGCMKASGHSRCTY